MTELEQLLQQAQSALSALQQQQQREHEFASQSQTRFDNNLQAFEKYFPDIAKAVKDYQPRKNFKILVASTGVGNFIPENETVPLYAEDPIAQSQAQVEKYTQKASFGRVGLYKKSPDAEVVDTRLHVRYMNELASTIAELTADTAEPEIKSLPQRFPTCVMFGLGLGYHVPMLLENHHFDYIYICEPDFELFFASLYCLDWSAVIETVNQQNASLFLQIGITYEDFVQKLVALNSQVGAFSIINCFCYQHYPSENINKLIKNFFENFYQFQSGFGFYNDAVTGLAHAVHNIEKSAHFLNRNKLAAKQLKNIPLFIVANGPSFDESIDEIRRYQDRAIIFAAGTGLQSLIKAGITPDFHIMVERTKHTYRVLYDTADHEALAKVNLLAVDVIYPDMLDLYKWSGLGLKGPEASSFFMQFEHYRNTQKVLYSLGFASPLVANTAAAFAWAFGFKEIYLFGVDNGYPIDTNHSHSKYSIYRDEKYQGKYKAKSGTKHRLEGNLGQDVMATSLMATSKLYLELLFSKMRDTHIYNVGSGAKLRHTHALEAEDIIVPLLPNAKDYYVEFIKREFFDHAVIEDIAERVGFDEFDSLVNYLIDIGEREYSTRAEAAEILKAQARVVYAYQNKKYAHIFHIVKGTLLYFHCPLITLLFTYQSDELTLQWFRQAFAVWQRFLHEIKHDFPENWKKKCDYVKHQPDAKN
ncbi:motility associated factor glycosyltransferase family protein [Rheinheimera maricola]|uniref:DUF115 domain-containing protein n=1 Tax=Rheinheimera maricola TaxID=2793282 RepID=A0ABS7X5W9_9GAMM|nr:6-hydroxymethylpterin diphosphokinase MptE-like protein [Rheinheimera maricola]MBZ9610212.1 DUF115 domain-containing protein [Rheinheimera maricola]